MGHWSVSRRIAPFLERLPEYHRVVNVADADAVLQLLGEGIGVVAGVTRANEGKRLTAAQWVAKWKEVAKGIRKRFPDIPDAAEDLEMIDSFVEKGELIKPLIDCSTIL